MQNSIKGASISIRAVNPQQDYNPQTKGAERRAGILIYLRLFTPGERKALKALAKKSEV